MKSRFLVFLFVCVLGLWVSAPGAGAQGRPPAGPPPGGGMPPPGSATGGSGTAAPQGTTSLRSSSRSASGARSSVQFGPVGRWWDDKAVIKIVGISADQQKKMDAIFNANKPAILQSYKAFLSEQTKLQTLNKNSQADRAQLFAAIDAESKARAALQKATAEMLLQIREQMAPEQIEKVEKLE